MYRIWINPFPRKGLVANLRSQIRRCPKAAQGIVAEIPQKSHGRFRGIGAESPVFLPAGGQKNAHGFS
jgi:hypothetical protein